MALFFVSPLKLGQKGLTIDIMITIEMKPIINEVEIPGYGKFEVSPLGAGAEAEIMVAFRELKEARDKAKEYDYLIDKEKKNELDKESQEYKDALGAYKNVTELADRVRSLTLEKLRAVIKGDNVEKLFQDFTYEQLNEIHDRATKK